jgi:peptidoglycan/LPS O-acetylase OafA/YrhL
LPRQQGVAGDQRVAALSTVPGAEASPSTSSGQAFGRTAPAHEALGLVDLVKAVAAQAILWHHFALYGPMSDAVNPLLGGLAGWLIDDARLAVQCFLVVGGFLAARSLARTAERGSIAAWMATVGRRFRRLSVPLMFALVLAILAAELAGRLIDHPSTPGDPTLPQILAHLLLLQDIVGQEALSAGVWYVAIDFQLFALFSLLMLLPRGWTMLLVAALLSGSLFWFNRVPALDVWAPYFFGAYGLGILAWRANRATPRWLWLAIMALLVALALLVDWRSRILLAGVTALLIAASGGRFPLGPVRPVIEWLSAISYALFLLHYPVLLAVGAVVHAIWPATVVANAAGLAIAWALSLGLAHLLHRRVEVAWIR